MHLTCTVSWSVVRLFVVGVPILVAVANKLPDPDSRQSRRGEDQPTRDSRKPEEEVNQFEASSQK